jgi:Tfp pilus assembly protein PilV
MCCPTRASYRLDAEAGSSLVEAIVAALILAAGVTAMAQLFSIAIASNVTARSRTVAMILAQQKIEELRIGTLSTTSVDSVEHLNGSGAIVGRDSEPPPQAVYTRRWSVEPATSGAEAAVVRVRVTARGVGRTEVTLTVLKAATIE